MNEPVAYLNGRWLPASEALIPVSDAGFVLGTTVAEQVRTFAGKLFRLADHLGRLAHSLEIIEVDPGVAWNDLGRIADELAHRNHALLEKGDDLGLSIVVTPGNYPTFSTVGPTQPNLCLHTYRLPFHTWAEKYRNGQALVTTAVQQVPAECWPPTLKCRSRMHYYLADRHAKAIDPQARALLLDGQGLVTEASTANLLVYRRHEGLVSPPWTKILHGISLAVATELASQLGIPTVQRELTVDDVASADEVLLTSTSICVLPVTRFNQRMVGDGKPGPMFAKLLAAWSQMVNVDVVAQAERVARLRT